MDRVYEESEIDSVARELLESLAPQESATVVSLTGDLGAGKTTLVQALGDALGVHEHIVSPTFVIMKKYTTQNKQHTSFYHLDAYRIEELRELDPLGWQQLVLQPQTLVVVEWGERIKDALPADTYFFTIEHRDTKRRIYATT